ncbi:MAG TPA: efflux RND transporter periplasmic adaptor subunit [Pyrinomonadaceae bacterium]|nr:efflux RND transporter periplasmic adaptor subunit [Pyrinomonadaceae bacterium]
MAMSHIKVILCAFVIAACLSCGSSGGGRNRGANSNANTGDTGPTINITVGKAEARTVASSINATGTLVAAETSDVAPKVAGKLSNVYVNVGQFVGAGAQIAKIDDTDARLRFASSQTAVRQAQVGVRQAEARIGLLEGGRFESSAVPEVRTAAANYQQALAEQKQAEANEKRYRELTETGDVAMAAYETYRTARDTARARSNAAKEQLNAAVNAAKQNNQAIAAARAGVEAAQNQVRQAQQDIADTMIYAPYPGYVSARPVAVGEFVSTSTSVITLLRTNPIKAEIQIAEADVPYAAIGRGVAVKVDAYKDRNFGGTVSAVNPAVDPSSRSATVEALIENGDNALRPGMFATASITREGGAPGVFVPQSAVAADPTTNNYKVFVIVDGVAHLKVVQLGTEEGDFQQILTGLNGDETIATSAVDQLFEGAKVAF